MKVLAILGACILALGLLGYACILGAANRVAEAIKL